MKPSAVVDWGAPLVAVPVDQNACPVTVQIDKTFAVAAGQQFVRFPCNVWTRRGPSGTWAVNAEGYLTAGISPEGYNGLYVVANA